MLESEAEKIKNKKENKMKHIKQLKNFAFFLALVVFAGSALSAAGQTTSTFTTGLTTPNKIITAGDNSLLVTEAGTTVPNTGRVSRVNRTTGARQTLINGLPSGVNNLGGPPVPSGPSALKLRGHTLFLTISTGDGVQNVGPGLESPNPNPSSPIYDSVLELTLPGNYEEVTSAFTLTFSDQTTLAGGGEVELTNADGENLTVRMIANFPNYIPNPRPGFPNNQRASNIFGVEMFQKDLYVVDSAFNLIYRVGIADGSFAPFVTFPNKPNPMFPTLGAPVIEPVPDNIHRVGNRLIVPLLTGFPFVVGFSEIQSVSLKSGERETFIPNLTSAIDVLNVADEVYFTLEFSANQLGGAPGRIRFFASPNAAPVTIVSNLISPTSMARDEKTGDIFVTNIFPGTVTRVQIP
jgi:hypothetical protein